MPRGAIRGSHLVLEDCPNDAGTAGVQMAVWPPSITSALPVTKRASSEAR